MICAICQPTSTLLMLTPSTPVCPEHDALLREALREAVRCDCCTKPLYLADDNALAKNCACGELCGCGKCSEHCVCGEGVYEYAEMQGAIAREELQ